MKNIIFNSVSIANFLSIGKEITISFNNGIHVITGYNLDKDDGNGVGKSTIVDAFFFTLFGETLRDLKKEEIVNNIAKKGCKVSLNFDIDKNGVKSNYKIERGLSPSFCKIFINNVEEKTLSTIPATNNYILNLINSTPAVFRNTITMGINNSVPFMSQKKNEKRDFIEGILRLELFKIMNKVTKENHDIVFKDYDFTIKSHEENGRNIVTYFEKKELFEKNRIDRITYLLERCEQYKQELKNLNNTIIEIDEESLKKLQTKFITNQSNLTQLEKVKYSLLTSKVEVERDITQNENKLKDISTKLLTLKDTLEPLTKMTLGMEEDILKSVDAYNITIDSNKAKIIELDRDIKDLNANIKSITETGSFCDKCKRPFPENDVKKNEENITGFKKQIIDKGIEKQKYLKDIQDTKQLIDAKTYELENTYKKSEILVQIVTLAQERKIIQERIPDLHKQVNAHILTEKETTEDIQKIKTEQDTLQASVYELKAKKDKNDSTKKLITNTTTTITNCENDIKKVESEKNEFEELLSNAENKKLALEKKIADYKEKVAIYDIIKFVVSDEGVKSYIIKKLLSILNERINYYLIKMDANCTLTFDEYFEDKIINDRNLECSYYNFSAGERKRIDLSCLFAFMDLRRIQGDVSFNVTFYDELLDSALSKDGSEKVFQILKERMDKYNETAYIITHKRDNLTNPLITDIIYLEKLGGITRLAEFKK